MLPISFAVQFRDRRKRKLPAKGRIIIGLPICLDREMESFVAILAVRGVTLIRITAWCLASLPSARQLWLACVSLMYLPSVIE